jgi:hypothetical protein
MYLFSRQARLAPGQMRDGIGWAVGQCERAARISGLPVSLFSQVFSPRLGSLSWTAFVPDLASLETADEKLMLDAEYLSAIDEGTEFLQGGVDDLLFTVVHGEPDPERDVRYVSTVQAVCSSGNLGRGMEVGVQIAQRAEEISGMPTMFVANATGPYGGVAWLTGFESVQALEAGEGALLADPTWVELIDRDAAGVYVEEPTVTVQTIYRRVV